MIRNKKRRVLIVEDEVLVGEMVRGVSEEIDYTVVGEATDGLEAIALIEGLQLGAVLMDIEMPDWRGPLPLLASMI